MVGVAARVQNLHGDLGPLVLVHRLGHMPVDAHLFVCVDVWASSVVGGGRGVYRQPSFMYTSRELVSLAAKGDSFPWRFGAMPPVTMSPTPFLALYMCIHNIYKMPGCKRQESTDPPD